MTVILEALQKARASAGQKAPLPASTALASFRFGRSSRAGQLRRAVLLSVLMLVGLSGIGYTATVTYKRIRKPKPAAARLALPHAAAASPAGLTQQAASVARDADNIQPAQMPEPVDRPRLVRAEAPNTATGKTSTETPVTAALAAIPAPVRDSFELGVFYFKSGDHLKALAEFNKVLDRDPLNKAAYNNVGLIHLKTSNTIEAIKAFRQAIIIDARYSLAHNNLGLAYRQAGQDRDARREFELALQLNPKNSAALTNLAGLSQKSGNIAQARTEYMKALKIDPMNSEANYNIADIYEQQGENAKAITYLKTFLAIGAHPDIDSDVERRIKELSKK